MWSTPGGVGRAARHHSVAAGEVILCGGAINTPQLLQLSGVRDRALLAERDVPVVQRLPGVGENLQDRLEVYIEYASKQPVPAAPGLAWHQRPEIAWEGLFQREGLGATNHFEGGGFARSNEDVAWPNLIFHFLPIAIRYDGTSPIEGHGYQVHIGPMYADTRGWARIRSKDPRAHRSLQFTTSRRLRTARSGWRRSAWHATSSTSRRSNPSTPARSRTAPRSRPTRRSSSGSARTPETALHPSCTARHGYPGDVGDRPHVDEGARHRGPPGL